MISSICRFQFAGAAHDGFFDVVGGHGNALGGGDGGAQARVTFGSPHCGRLSEFL